MEIEWKRQNKEKNTIKVRNKEMKKTGRKIRGSGSRTTEMKEKKKKTGNLLGAEKWRAEKR